MAFTQSEKRKVLQASTTIVEKLNVGINAGSATEAKQNAIISSMVGLSTDAKLETIRLLLTSIDSKDFATEVSLVKLVNTIVSSRLQVDVKSNVFDSKTNGYEVSRDDTSGTTKYFGFINDAGKWYIMEIDKLLGTYKYINGTSLFLTSWSNRVTLTYAEFNTLTW